MPATRPVIPSTAATTTTATDINLGIVNCVVGFAPNKPAEFVHVIVTQMAGQVDV